MRITRTGLLLTGIMLAFYFASLTSQSAFLLLPVGILAGCFAMNIFGARRSITRLRVEAPMSTSIEEGGALNQPWKIANAAKREIGQLTLESKGQTLLQIAAIPAKGEVNTVPGQQFSKRGVYRFAELQVSSTFPFGLIKAEGEVTSKGEVIVYPAIYPAPCPKAAGFDTVVGGKFHGQRRSAAGTNFAGLRPFHAGDPLKQIHWKSSSKGRGLMVKMFEEELSGRVAIITDGPGVKDARALDDCLRAAGSLMFAALDAGHHVEWVDLSTNVCELFPPFTDGQEILHLLARVEAGVQPLANDALHQAVRLVSRRGAISFVLSHISAELIDELEELAASGRDVTLYLPAHIELPMALHLPVTRYNAEEVLAS